MTKGMDSDYSESDSDDQTKQNIKQRKSNQLLLQTAKPVRNKFLQDELQGIKIEAEDSSASENEILLRELMRKKAKKKLKKKSKNFSNSEMSDTEPVMPSPISIKKEKITPMSSANSDREPKMPTPIHIKQEKHVHSNDHSNKKKLKAKSSSSYTTDHSHDESHDNSFKSSLPTKQRAPSTSNKIRHSKEKKASRSDLSSDSDSEPTMPLPVRIKKEKDTSSSSFDTPMKQYSELMKKRKSSTITSSATRERSVERHTYESTPKIKMEPQSPPKRQQVLPSESSSSNDDEPTMPLPVQIKKEVRDSVASSDSDSESIMPTPSSMRKEIQNKSQNDLPPKLKIKKEVLSESESQVKSRKKMEKAACLNIKQEMSESIEGRDVTVKVPTPLKQEKHTEYTPSRKKSKQSQESTFDDSNETNSAIVTPLKKLSRKTNSYKTEAFIDTDSSEDTSSKIEKSNRVTVPVPHPVKEEGTKERTKEQKKVKEKRKSEVERSRSKSRMSFSEQDDADSSEQYTATANSSQEVTVEMPSPIKETNKSLKKERRKSITTEKKRKRSYSQSEEVMEPKRRKEYSTDSDSHVRESDRTSQDSGVSSDNPKINVLQQVVLSPKKTSLNKLSFEEKIKYLYPGAKEVECHSKIIDKISDDQPVNLLRIPKNIDPAALKGLYIDLDSEVKFKIEGENNEKFVIRPVRCSQPNQLIITDKPKLVRCEKILTLSKYTKKKKNRDIPIPEETPIPQLENLPERHPLFGADYAEKINLKQETIEKLDRAIEELRKKAKKDKKKEKKEKLSRQSNQDIEVIQMLESHNKKNKKKHKERKNDV